MKTITPESEESEEDEDITDNEFMDFQKQLAFLTSKFNNRIWKKNNSSSNRLHKSSTSSKRKDRPFDTSMSKDAEDVPKCFKCRKLGNLIKDCRLPKKNKDVK
ncbi:unnamed protein product [Cuscuta epithymum]|uniref:CCHC-type domain-containing protein n=1 Tax=Cuscuta epithymum TaxID=186058 RepID=A0AAV0CU69_9ASTE|nr:unnamed protein product [Cuscuta epithymum]